MIRKTLVTFRCNPGGMLRIIFSHTPAPQPGNMCPCASLHTCKTSGWSRIVSEQSQQSVCVKHSTSHHITSYHIIFLEYLIKVLLLAKKWPVIPTRMLTQVDRTKEIQICVPEVSICARHLST